MAKDVYETASGRRSRFRREVFAMWGDVCWLCHRPGADTADHVVPRAEIRRLGLPTSMMFDPDNGRPAHKSCNSRRGAKPVRREVRRESARGW